MICKHCGETYENISSFEFASHVRNCPKKPKQKKIVFPDITVYGIREPWSSRPIKMIRKKCIDCSAGQFIEVDLCPAFKCPLWTYRFGERPKTAFEKGRAVTEEHYEAIMVERKERGLD